MATIKRFNNAFGTTTDSPLSSTATTMNSQELPRLGAIATSGEFARVTLDPGYENGDPEIIHVTDYDGTATSATIERGKEGTTAREHASGTTWEHAPTVLDFHAPGYDIEQGGDPDYTDQGLSDEFATSSLNSSWTVVTGSSGTVDLLGTVAVAVYDLSTRENGMLVQTGSDSGDILELRAGVIADGEEIILCATPADIPETDNNQYRVGLSINDDNSAYNGGNIALLYFDGSNRSAIAFYDGTVVGEAWEVGGAGERGYFRIVRNGDTYHAFYSKSGDGWAFLGAVTISTAAYVWVFAGSESAWVREGSGDPITALHWVRHLTHAGHDPW